MLKRFLVSALFAASLPALALAQSTAGTGPVATAWGPRVGFSSGPNQLVFGAQLDLGNLAPDLTLTPNVDLGIGDHVTTFAINGDLHYHFRLAGSPWRPYVGGGLGITHSSFDYGNNVIADNSSTDLGAALIVGAIVPTQSGSRFFAEAKLGLGSIADLKLLVGWNFKL